MNCYHAELCRQTQHDEVSLSTFRSVRAISKGLYTCRVTFTDAIYLPVNVSVRTNGITKFDFDVFKVSYIKQGWVKPIVPVPNALPIFLATGVKWMYLYAYI